jgi:hypothetical protein
MAGRMTGCRPPGAHSVPIANASTESAMKPLSQAAPRDGNLRADQPRTPGDASRPQGPSLPHDRDQQATATAAEPDPHIERAARDLQQGQVDTDLRATPGLDADRRGGMVKGGERGASQPQKARR